MPELKGLHVELGVEGVERNSLVYLDKKREAARLAKIAQDDGSKGKEKKRRKGKSEAWTEKTQQKVVREVRKEKRKNRRIAGMSDERKAKEEEWKELVEEVKKERAERGLLEGNAGGGGFEDMV